MEQLGAVAGLFVGRVEERWPDKPPSAIAKRAVSGPLQLEAAGFEQDSQADLAVHGGVEKALHHYAAEHYDFWKLDTYWCKSSSDKPSTPLHPWNPKMCWRTLST